MTEYSIKEIEEILANMRKAKKHLANMRKAKKHQDETLKASMRSLKEKNSG
jgi:hypothetical protein